MDNVIKLIRIFIQLVKDYRAYVLEFHLLNNIY